jgi:hypothetical protein
VPDGLGGFTYNYTLVYTPYHVANVKLSSALIDAIGGTDATVGSLYTLANNVLGGDDLPENISISEIASAVDMINNVFDECRSIYGWVPGETAPLASSFCIAPSSSTPCPQFVQNRSSEINRIAVASSNNVKVSAYPNPFTDVVKFTIESKVSGQAQLEVVNMVGQKVATVYNGYIKANHNQVVEFRASSIARTNLIYVLKINGQQVSGKLLNAKE